MMVIGGDPFGLNALQTDVPADLEERLFPDRGVAVDLDPPVEWKVDVGDG